VSITDEFPEQCRAESDKGYDPRRREFFKDLLDSAKETAAKTVDMATEGQKPAGAKEQPSLPKVGKDGTLPHSIPRRREALLASLRTMGEPEDIMVNSRLFGHVIIDVEKCSSCQMCATFCPTGAIAKFKEASGTFGVTHSPGICVRCRCCEDICRMDALWLSESVFATDLLSGVVERYEMRPSNNKGGTAQGIWHSMRDLLGCDQVYER
jgi:Pyruvate/2-oxoacid:ferredoxin oxidoreductase delta subunit